MRKTGPMIVISLLAAGALHASDTRPAPLTPEQLAHHAVKVAAVQMDGNWIWQGNDDMPAETADAVVGYIDRAGADGADLVLFPELLLGKFRVPCETTEKIADAARRNRVNVAVGCFEIIDDEGSYGNSTLVFDRQGVLVGRYFKSHEAAGEPPYLWPPLMADPEGEMTPGPDLNVIDLDFGRIGIFTCYDGYFPEVPRVMALRGAEILLWPNARGGDIERHLVHGFMQHNYAHVVTSNKAMGSNTMIAHWPNQFPAVAEEPGEAYIVATLYMDQLRLARKHAREFLQRRPDLYAAIADADLYVPDYYVHLPEPEGAPEPMVALEPVVVESPVAAEAGLDPGTPLSPLAIRMRAPWMQGWITLRLPETLTSSLGCQFIDHVAPAAPQKHPLDPWPAWRYDRRTFAWSYETITADGISFSAEARPYRGVVFLEFAVRNDTDETVAYLEPNACLNLDGSIDFDAPWETTPLHALIDGQLRSLDAVTPTPAEKGRRPWFLFLDREQADVFTGGEDSPTWWLADQRSDGNLMYAVSGDEEHLVGYAWDVSPVHLMSNCGNPCLHTGPAPIRDLAPGQRVTRRGKVYFLANDPEALLAQYQRDKQTWARWPRRP